MKIVYDCYQSPIGAIYVIADENGIRKVVLTEEVWSQCRLEYEDLQREAGLCGDAVSQLDEYFKGKRYEFSLPLSIAGTEFSKKVWKSLTDIPYGETKSYSEIAQEIGSPKACRAVGQANGRNPLPIIVPCHRVVGGKGQLTGYLGKHTEIKKYLLDMERSYK